MTSRADRYRKQAAICAAADNGDPDSGRKLASAAEEMRRLVTARGGLEELAPLLDEPGCSRWLAFQLLELCDPPPEVADRCLELIREMASGSSPEAVGARAWLREH